MGVTKKKRDTVFTHAHRKHIHTHTRRKLTGKPWIKEASRTMSSLLYYCNASILFFFLSGISRANSLLSRFFCARGFLLHSFAVSSGTNGIETAESHSLKFAFRYSPPVEYSLGLAKPMKRVNCDNWSNIEFSVFFFLNKRKQSW